MFDLNWVNFGKKNTLSVFISLITGSCGLIPSVASNIHNCQADSSFVFIREGKFIAGSDREERDYGYQISAQTIAKNENEIQQAEQKLRQSKWFDREHSRQNIKTNSFCISRNLVTNEEYLAFVRATGYRVPGISADDYQQQGFLVHPYSEVRAFLWQDGTYPQEKAQHPVVLVSYEDALAYAQWKGQQTGNSYRLPTAIEWEKAARGNDARYFPWGNQWRDDATNWAGSKLNYTSAIANYPLSRSPYGVEDMAGNVFEFTSTLQTTQQGEVSVMKGCSWDDLPGFCRAAYQHTRSISSRHILFGFRLVKE
jgi:formylglycine-generating enzyme required for sulfatase activity